jgi:hypothetical protein
MADSRVVSAPREKRAELSGELIAAEKRIVQLRADLESIDGALRVFDPLIAAHKIRPVLRRRQALALPRGQGSRIIMDALRRADAPLTVREIAERIAADYRFDAGTTAMNKLVSKVRNILARQRPGIVAREVRGTTVVWRLA